MFNPDEESIVSISTSGLNEVNTILLHLLIALLEKLHLRV